ncbi:MAG: oxygenase MpaB family protein [Polyangiaceae bacterium]
MTYTSFGQIPTRFVNLPAARAAYGDRVDRLAPFLLRGDPLADAALSAMKERSHGKTAKEAYAWLDAGARTGAESIPEAPAEVRAFFEAQERVPAWADWEIMNRGGKLLLRAGLIGGLVLGAKSIVLGYASPGGNKPLILAGGLTARAPRRLNETARYVRGVVSHDGLRPPADGKPAGDGYVASCKVRIMHAQVRALLLTDPRWDTKAWGLPINQHDMMATGNLFSTVLVDGLEALGLRASADEVASYMHLWRFAAKLMGVDDELLVSNIAEGRRWLDIIEATQAPPDDDSRALTAALFASSLQEAGPSSAEKRAALRSAHLLRGAAFELLGEDAARALGIAPTPLQRAVPLLRRAIRAAEWSRSIGAFDETRLKLGMRYWDDIATKGYRLYGAPFSVPTALAP